MGERGGRSPSGGQGWGSPSGQGEEAIVRPTCAPGKHSEGRGIGELRYDARVARNITE